MRRVSAPSYDLFKLMIALVLMGILILMLLRGCATNAVPIPITGVTPAGPGPTDAAVASGPTDSPTALPIPPTTAPTEIPTEIVPSPSPVVASPEPAATVATPATDTPAPDVACNTSLPSRLSVGQMAQVAQRLNMRTTASIDAAIILTNAVNTEVEIIGGPMCTPVGGRAYLWWQIRLADGTEGWSAETPLNEAIYLLEPVP